jgi:hypothetical protein
MNKSNEERVQLLRDFRTRLFGVLQERTSDDSLTLMLRIKIRSVTETIVSLTKDLNDSERHFETKFGGTQNGHSIGSV